MASHTRGSSTSMDYATTFLRGLPIVNIGELSHDCQSCDICYTTFNSGRAPESPIRLPCGHCLGANCIARWLSTSRTCPMCRSELFPGDRVSPAGRRAGSFATRVEIPWLDAYIRAQLTDLIINVSDELHASSQQHMEPIEVIERAAAVLRRDFQVPTATTLEAQSYEVDDADVPGALELYNTFRALSSSSRSNDESHYTQWESLARQIEAKRVSLPPVTGIPGFGGRWLQYGLDLRTLRNPSMWTRVNNFMLTLSDLELGHALL
jgi:hypothetical protein